MAKFITSWNTTAEYDAVKDSLVTPQVALVKETNTVNYQPKVTPPTPTETRVVAKFNVTDTSNPTKILNALTGFSSIEIDGVEQPSVITGYTFNTAGEHTVKYTLVDPTSISIVAFDGCWSLTSIVIPNGVTSISDYAFRSLTGLTSITIPDSVTSIGSSAFTYCRSLTSITIPDSVTSIGDGAFRSCSGLTSIDIPSGVTSIGSGMCSGCTSLTNAIIGSGVTSIGDRAFYRCSGLISITIYATTPPTLAGDPFDSTTNYPIYVPAQSMDAYKKAWYYGSRIQPIA